MVFQVKFRKTISIAVSAALLLTSAAVPAGKALAEEDENLCIAYNTYCSGKYGENADYFYYKAKEDDVPSGIATDSFLVLEGTGEMYDVDNDYMTSFTLKPHWDAQGWRRASFNEGDEAVTNPADYAYITKNLAKVYVNGLSSLGENCCYYDIGIKTIYLGSSVTSLKERSLSYTELDDIYIYGELKDIASTALEGMSIDGTITINNKVHVADANTAALLESAGIKSSKIVQDLDPAIDEVPLRIALEKADMFGKLYPEGAGYTQNSWKALTDAAKAGTEALNAEEKTAESISTNAAVVNAALEGLVSTASLAAAVSEAEKLVESDYDSSTWAPFAQALSAAREGLKSAASEDEIASLTKALEEAMAGLKLLTVEDAKAALEAVAGQTEGLVETDYSPASWEALQSALAKKDEVASSVTASAIAAVTAEIQDALNGLKVEYPDEWFSLGGIRYQTMTTILSGTVEKEMAGATQIEIVFDCTEETSYNEWASIDLSCDVDGEQAAYVQFKGKGDYTTGTKAWKEILEIPALRAGASYKVQGTTYAWSNITDDIYRIQAVNFYDDDETLLMSVEAANGPADVVNSAVAEAEKKAEALHTGDYTEDSIAAVKELIASAKALEGADSMLPSEINKVLQSLEDMTELLVPADTADARKAMDDAVAEAEALKEGDYTAESWAALQTAVEAAKNVSENALNSEIEALSKAVTDAMAALEKVNSGEEPQPTDTTETPVPDQPTNSPGNTPTDAPGGRR